MEKVFFYSPSHSFDVCVCDIIIMILMSTPTAAAMRSVMAIVRVTSKELTVIIVIAIIINVIIIDVIMNIDGTNRLKAVLSAVRQRFCFQLHREAGGAARKNQSLGLKYKI